MKSNLRIISDLLIFILFSFFLLYWMLFLPPKNFPAASFVTISEGASLTEVADYLENRNIIKSSGFFVILAEMLGEERNIRSGEYFLEKPLPIWEVISRLSAGNLGIKQEKITVIEGSTVEDIAEDFGHFYNFNKKEFFEITKGEVGYLFPDTYFVMPNITAAGVLNIMNENFERKVAEIDFNDSEIGREYGLDKIIIMASLIEKEVSDTEDRKVVSGILWKRLKEDMLLQVDAPFVYLLGKKSSELTMDDLKIDSPYNTYIYAGLPPAPICNPGLDAILAALNPSDSSYWYYLSDAKSKIYFAKTFEEHKINKSKYLFIQK